MADLITATRAKYNLNNLTTSSAEDDTLDALIGAVSAAIERYCRRTFAQTSYSQLYHGNGSPTLALEQYPILSVSRVAGNLQGVLRIANTATANQRATVAVTAAGLTLVRVASGVASTDTSVTWASNATLDDVVDAVSGLGNGWTAEVVGEWGGRASADLFAPQGALNVRDQPAELRLHTDEVREFEIDAERGLLRRDAFGLVWATGVQNYRVDYSAGYASIPEDVQEACAQWVAELFWQTKSNPGAAPMHPPIGVRLLLEPWRRFNV